jgi:hypothetical protein
MSLALAMAVLAIALAELALLALFILAASMLALPLALGLLLGAATLFVTPIHSSTCTSEVWGHSLVQPTSSIDAGFRFFERTLCRRRIRK